MKARNTEAGRSYSLVASPVVTVGLVVALLCISGLRAIVPACCMVAADATEASAPPCCCPEVPFSASMITSGVKQSNHFGLKECCVIRAIALEAGSHTTLSEGSDAPRAEKAAGLALVQDWDFHRTAAASNRSIDGPTRSLRLHLAHQVFLC